MDISEGYRYSRVASRINRHRKVMKLLLSIFLLIYAVITIFPFYVLFIRTFVSTKDSTELHLWIPTAEEVSLDYEVGNLSVFYNLDVRKFKEQMGIPINDYLPSRMTLKEIADKYSIPVVKLKRYFSGFSTFNGWLVTFGSGGIWTPLGRSIIITVLSVVVHNVLSLFTGLGLAGLKRKDQMFVYNLYMLQVIIPIMLIILPQFVIVQLLLRLIPGYDTPGLTRQCAQILALIIINVRGGAVPVMIYTSYIGSIPRELEEAAIMDGASRLQYIRYILLPLLTVPIATNTVIHLPLFWNGFLEPFVYLDSNSSNLLTYINSFSGTHAINFQALYTGIFASILPLALIYIIFRKWFIGGVMAGAIKG